MFVYAVDLAVLNGNYWSLTVLYRRLFSMYCVHSAFDVAREHNKNNY
jgi:hypothetical protein